MEQPIKKYWLKHESVHDVDWNLSTCVVGHSTGGQATVTSATGFPHNIGAAVCLHGVYNALAKDSKVTYLYVLCVCLLVLILL